MKVLIVEDDQFKLDALRVIVEAELIDAKVEFRKSVQAAVKAITSKDFDLLVLDMSLPSHDLDTASGLGIPRLSGGIEVLFEMQYQRKFVRTIIVTQYPEIELENQMIPIHEVAKYLMESFEIEVECCLFFDYENTNWSELFKKRVLKK